MLVAMSNQRGKEMETFSDIVEFFGEAELAAAAGLEPVAGARWRQRNSIPPEHWLAVLQHAAKSDVALTAHRLAEMAAAKGPRKGAR